ncbi:isocitrate lyase/phosphoenolpyruvate mutase family protein [Qipengyuania flava]|uniref:isocitrate lyase/phosphoenolpyruvate mutase family protein n=1 Tax=Qipengyuania flava TaxID=192812 RepID=UPI00273D7DCC|nr:isocitrate lyase/phosphoenolpyruvate mutase family protein [Qipengyuania flava]
MKTIDDFAALHRAGDPLVLFNVWDAGSAAAVAEAGAKAIATGSLSLAGAQGYDDGEGMPGSTEWTARVSPVWGRPGSATDPRHGSEP